MVLIDGIDCLTVIWIEQILHWLTVIYVTELMLLPKAGFLRCVILRINRVQPTTTDNSVSFSSTDESPLPQTILFSWCGGEGWSVSVRNITHRGKTALGKLIMSVTNRPIYFSILSLWYSNRKLSASFLCLM